MTTMTNPCTYIVNSWNGPCGREAVPGTDRCGLHQEQGVSSHTPPPTPEQSERERYLAPILDNFNAAVANLSVEDPGQREWEERYATLRLETIRAIKDSVLIPELATATAQARWEEVEERVRVLNDLLSDYKGPTRVYWIEVYRESALARLAALGDGEVTG